MSAALTISQPRHLALPECALFAPCELNISNACSQVDFIRIVRAVSQLDQANDLWKADAALHSIKHWGKEEGLAITAEASGLSKFFLYKASFVAKRFPPEHRQPGYKYSAYRELMPFPPEWAYAFLVRHVDEKLSSKSLRALAVSEFGSEPYKNRQPKKRSVSIRCELYARLSEYAPSRKVASFIETLLENWLKTPVGDRISAVPAPDANSPCPKVGRPIGSFRPFTEARDFCRSLNLSNMQEWRRWCRCGDRPSDIPAHPYTV